MNNLETIIGIEIHIELNTKTKMFSPGENTFNGEPNKHAHFTDLAYPGTMPRPNKAAVQKAIKLAKALNMKIDNLLRFDRKNYFYADLPKGFQITQQDFPIGKSGSIPITIGSHSKNIEIERIQLEEDTAKSLHNDEGTLLDYNRAGVPLIEIITNPVIKNEEEAVAYVEAIRTLVTTLGISEAKMEEGSLRADINISLRPFGSNKLGTKIEIKNINTLTNIKKAIKNEISSQTSDILKGNLIYQETKRFDEATNKNIAMRSKTDATDYKFFREPNIAPILLDDDFINSVKLPELPWVKRSRYESYGLKREFIDQLMSDLNKSIFFDSINFEDKEMTAKIFFAEIVSLSNSKKISVEKLNIDPMQISSLLKKLQDGEISGKQVKGIIPMLANSKKTVSEIVEENGYALISDPKMIKAMILETIDKNKQFIDSNLERKERVVKFILGNIMKLSKGQANPVLTSKLVKEILDEV